MTRVSAPTALGRPGGHDSLRRRLMTIYGALALLTVVLASGASLAIFEYQSERRSRQEMAGDTASMASALEASAEDRRDARLRTLIVRSRGIARTLSDVLIIDEDGRVIEASGRFAGSISSFPITNRSSSGGLPTVRRVRLEGFPTLYTASMPLPTIGDQLGLPGDVSLVMLRPAAELQGTWRSLLPSIALVGSLALLLSGAMAVPLARSISRPLEALTAASERIAEGDLTVRVDEEGSDELVRLARSFNTMAREVGEANARQRDFIANVGHDLRTPLTSIVGFTDALRDGTARSDTDRRTALASIAGAADRMRGLVEQLLELAQLEQHATGLHLVRCDVRALLERAADAVAGQSAAREVSIEVEAAEGSAVRADAQWLGRALANVVDNAVRHSETGGAVKLTARPSATDGESSSERAMVAIEVADTGSGIAPQDIPRVFERFFRGDTARTSGASGLGLSIAREIVEAHGGTIGIESIVGERTTVTLLVPAAVNGTG